MFKYISLALAFSASMVVSANAAPVLTNGGFEQNPPSSLGNNIPHSITPWVLGSGNQANVVKVTGPGGSYGSQAPESDASAPGAGIEQHYLDIAYGANDFYQEFTPLCDGSVEYGAYFSRRTGTGGGIAGIEIFRASDNSSIAPRQQTSLPLGTPKTDPWTRVAYTATLSANTTYKFYVDMDNAMNIDNAFVVFLDDCAAHEPPDFTTGVPGIDDVPGDDVSIDVTKTCDVATESETGGWQAACQISVTYDSGGAPLLQVSIDEQLFVGANLSQTLITSISSTDDWDCGTLPLSSDAGSLSCNWNTASAPPPPAGTVTSVLNVVVEFPDQSDHTWADTKNCVGAHFYVGAGVFGNTGDDLICADIIVPEPTGNDVSIDVTKTCDAAIETGTGALEAACQISVTYDSGELVPTQISIDEQLFVDGSLSQTMITSISSPDDWDCGTLPLSNDTAALSCLWNSGASTPPPAGNVTSVLDVVVQFPAQAGDEPQTAENCVSASFYAIPAVSADTGADMICADIEISEETAEALITKICDETAEVSNGYLAHCIITINLGEKDDISHPRFIFVQEQLVDENGDVAGDMISAFSGAGWNCDPANPPYATSTVPQCYLPYSDVPDDGVITLHVNVDIPSSDIGKTFENCAILTQVEYPVIDKENVTQELLDHLHEQIGATEPSGVVTNLGEACAEIKITEDVGSTNPDPQMCTAFEPEVSCNEAGGGYQVTLQNPLTGTFDPTSIDVTVLTAGVTAHSNPSNPLLLSLQGVSPGQTVLMSLASMEYGAGSQPGMDLCCMGEIEITIPQGLVCDPVHSTLDVTKTCEPFDGGDALGNTVCHLDVTYSGAAPTSANPIVITDSSTASTGVISFNGQDPTTADQNEWDCSANLFPTAGPAVCEMHNGIDTTATAGYDGTITPQRLICF